MTSRFARAAAWLAALVLFPMGAAMADTLSFANGGTVSGSFVYDQSTNTVVSFNFSSSEFGATTFSGPVSGSTSAVIISNTDGDEVFSFFAPSNDPSVPGDLNELDIVISCGGIANCATQGTVGNSFALSVGNPVCNPGDLCIASGEQHNILSTCLGSGCQVLMTAGNFVTVADPNCPANDTCDTLALSTTSEGTVFGSGNNGGGGTTGVPEPGTLVLSALGLAAFALKRACS